MACDGGGCSKSCLEGSGPCPSCGNGCSSGCSFCSENCGDGCKGDCSRRCSESCRSGCTGCTGSCKNTCNDGCTGGDLTTVYTNLTLQTLIKANDIINLNNLVNNEVTRRSKSATNTTITVGDLATAATINIIIENLNKVASTQSNLKAQYSIMDKSSMQALIDLAKDLYTKNIKS